MRLTFSDAIKISIYAYVMINRLVDLNKIYFSIVFLEGLDYEFKTTQWQKPLLIFSGVSY